MSSSVGGGWGSDPEGDRPTEAGYDPGTPSGYDPASTGYDTGAAGGYDAGAPGGIPQAGTGYAGGDYAAGDHQGGYAEETYQGASTAAGGATAGGATAGGATAGGYADTSYDSGGASAAGSGRPDVEDESVGSLVGKLTTDASKLIRQELDLAKAELREEVKKAGKAAGMLGGAGLAGLMVAIFASFTLIWLLDTFLPLWLAALIVTLLWGIAGAVMFSIGRKKLAEVNPKPEQTIETLKEDKQWVQAQKN